MSEINNNEKKNISERANREGENAVSSENRRNQKNNNNHRRYHHKKPYPKNNERGQIDGGHEKSVSKPASEVKADQNTNDVSAGAKKNAPMHVKNHSNRKGEMSQDGTKEFRRNPRQGGFDRRKSQNHVRVEETIQDIDIDIGRIEKEIELEIKEIATLKFGL